jgi:hypothetical protein
MDISQVKQQLPKFLNKILKKPLSSPNKVCQLLKLLGSQKRKNNENSDLQKG